MKRLLAWLFLVQIALSQAFTDHGNTVTLQPMQDKTNASAILAPSGDKDKPSSEPIELPVDSTVVEQRDELPPGTKSYSVWVTDENNDSQINDTRTWLEGLVHGKADMHEISSFPWDTPADIPEDELDKLWREGRLDQEIDKYRKVQGWGNLMLDPAGYEAVSKKKEWISDVEPNDMYKTVATSPLPELTLVDLVSRKFDWGEWDKQETAPRDLVRASLYE